MRESRGPEVRVQLQPLRRSRAIAGTDFMISPPARLAEAVLASRAPRPLRLTTSSTARCTIERSSPSDAGDIIKSNAPHSIASLHKERSGTSETTIRFTGTGLRAESPKASPQVLSETVRSVKMIWGGLACLSIFSASPQLLARTLLMDSFSRAGLRLRRGSSRLCSSNAADREFIGHPFLNLPRLSVNLP